MAHCGSICFVLVRSAVRVTLPYEVTFNTYSSSKIDTIGLHALTESVICSEYAVSTNQYRNSVTYA